MLHLKVNSSIQKKLKITLFHFEILPLRNNRWKTNSQSVTLHGSPNSLKISLYICIFIWFERVKFIWKFVGIIFICMKKTTEAAKYMTLFKLQIRVNL